MKTQSKWHGRSTYGGTEAEHLMLCSTLARERSRRSHWIRMDAFLTGMLQTTSGRERSKSWKRGKKREARRERQQARSEMQEAIVCHRCTASFYLGVCWT